MDWNAFDWILVAIVVISMGIAFRRGLVRAIFGMVGFVAGFLLAGWNYTTVGDWINNLHAITSQSGARIAAFLLIVVLVAVFFEVAGALLQKTLRVVGLGMVDRILGAVFGFVRGCLICIGLLMATTEIVPQAKVLTSSVLSPYLFAVAHDVSFLVPQYLQQLMSNGAFNFKQNPPH